jgi:hypothetical protein
MIEHASRRIRVLGAMAHPTAAWVGQTTRNLVMDLDDSGCKAQFLIRYRDGEYPGIFDAILAEAGITVVLSGIPGEALHRPPGVSLQQRRHLQRTRPPSQSSARRVSNKRTIATINLPIMGNLQ